METPELFLPPDHLKVWNALQGYVGRDNAVGKKDLAKITELHERTVRHCITGLVIDLGKRVCSTYGAAGQAGYYLPADDNEALEAAEALKRHALRILRRAAVLEKRTVDLAIASLPRLARQEDAA